MICTIKKGSHYSSGWSLGTIHSGVTEQSFTVMFDKNCIVLPGVAECDGDFNKLFGFSYGYHHSNSLRMAWKSQSGMIRIAGYQYDGGVRLFKGFINVVPDQWHTMNIRYDVSRKVAVYTCNGKSIELPYAAKPGFGYYLMPYYGGNCTAPATMKINLV